jgi:hypothetical protein
MWGGVPLSTGRGLGKGLPLIRNIFGFFIAKRRILVDCQLLNSEFIFIIINTCKAYRWDEEEQAGKLT